MKEMWNKRYAGEEYVYGIQPNAFFKEVLDTLDVGKHLLLPAEGEGRNAVYAAKKGYNVTAFDISEQAKRKAMRLAKSNNVNLNYQVGILDELISPKPYYNIAALVYVHMPNEMRSSFHKKIADMLQPGGVLILEGFSKQNLDRRIKNPEIGGPDKAEMLFSMKEIRNDFAGVEIKKLEEVEIDLNEGLLHNGKAKVIRFIGIKKE